MNIGKKFYIEVKNEQLINMSDKNYISQKIEKFFDTRKQDILKFHEDQEVGDNYNLPTRFVRSEVDYQAAKEFLIPHGFSLESALIVLYFHNIKKIWQLHKEKEIDKEEFYEILKGHNIFLSEEEKNALTYIDGEGKDYSSERVMRPLAAFCHCVEMKSSIKFDISVYPKTPAGHSDNKQDANVTNAHPEIDKFSLLRSFIEKLDDSRKEGILKFHDEHKDLICEAKGSKSKHQAWEGGYVDHLLQTFFILESEYEVSKKLGIKYDISLESAIIVLYFHDMEKIWKYTNRKEINKEEWYDEILKNNYNIEFSKEERQALDKIHGDKGQMTNFEIVCHCSDTMSARVFFDNKAADFPFFKNASKVFEGYTEVPMTGDHND